MPSHQPTAGDLAVKPEFSSSQSSAMVKPSEPNRNRAYDPKKPHVTDLPITRDNWYKHVNWLNFIMIIGVPCFGLVLAWWTPLQWKTLVWSVVYYFWTGLGITAGMYSMVIILEVS